MERLFDAIRSSLPLALGIAASPLPVIAVIILLMTPRALSNSYSFLLGWFIGLNLVGWIILLSHQMHETNGHPSSLAGWFRIILGSVFLITSLFFARNITKKGANVSPPRWQEKIDSYGSGHSIVIGFTFSGLNFKNATLMVAASSSIGSFNLLISQAFVVLIIFSILASIGVLVPIMVFYLLRSKSEFVFGIMKNWLIRKRIVILFVVLIIFGCLLIYRGLNLL